MTDINKFLKLSTSIGNDFSLVQGPGGNTSFKENENISIKKSGSYLKDSMKGEIFIKENLSKLKNFYNSNNTNKKYSPEMSIETPLHIIFDEKYVFHYHSMISVIISSGNNLEDIKELCTKLNITWISYKRPGSLLSDEVKVNLEKRDQKIFFLQNHGMLIASNDIDQIEGKIYELEEAMLNHQNIERESLFKELSVVGKNDNNLFRYRFDTKRLNSALQLNNKFLYPDHAVFGNYSFADISDFNSDTDDKIIYFDDENLLSLNPLNDTELEILRSILIVADSCEEIVNYIDKSSGDDLLSSEDEKLRIDKNL